METFKSQSAMEYLMTYGWAILSIAIVLGAIFGLGLFNSANLVPKVGPGSCQVYRPQGPGTTSFINTEGTCNNELPQYVAKFNGASSYINTGTTDLPLGNNQRSVFAWVYYTGAASGGFPYVQYVYGYGSLISQQSAALLVDANVVYFSGYSDDKASTLTVPINTWSFIGYTWAATSSNMVTMWLNGQSQNLNIVNALNTQLGTSPSSIGSHEGGFSQQFYGSIANLQVYNTSLTANEVTALYQEGIGGAPLVLNNLVAWWSLNGNANDYSGNLNNGVSTSVVFTSGWTSGYSTP